MLIGVLICVFSIICGLGVNYMDLESDKREGIVERRREEGSKINFLYLKKLKFSF